MVQVMSNTPCTHVSCVLRRSDQLEETEKPGTGCLLDSDAVAAGENEKNVHSRNCPLTQMHQVIISSASRSCPKTPEQLLPGRVSSHSPKRCISHRNLLLVGEKAVQDGHTMAEHGHLQSVLLLHDVE